LTESLVTAHDALKKLDGSEKQLTDEVGEQKKAASSKNENYKLEYSVGEKSPYENLSKSIKVILDKL
jgi:hypothetical protein